MKETSLKAGNFTVYVEKATEFSPGLRFSVGCSRIVSQVCQIQKLDWALGQWGTSSPVSPTSYVISVGHEGDQFESWKIYYICRKGH